MLTQQERNKLLAIITEADHQLAREMAGKVVITPKAKRLKQRIDEAREALDADEHEARQRLAHAAIPIDQALEVIAIPLLADVLNDLITGVDTTLRQAGVERTVFGDVAREIRRKALWMVDTLANANDDIPTLPDLVTDDEFIVEAIKKKLMSYIRQRLHITAK